MQLIGYVILYENGWKSKVLRTELVEADSVNEYLEGDGGKEIIVDVPGFEGRPFLHLEYYFPLKRNLLRCSEITTLAIPIG